MKTKVSAFIAACLLLGAFGPTALGAPGAKPRGGSDAAPAADAPTPAAAEIKNSGPDMTSETYGDWVMRCRPGGGEKRCELTQTIIIQGQPNPIAMIAFGRDKAGEPLRIVVQLPVNVTFEGGVRAALADGAGADLAFRRCTPVGCFADARLDEATVGQFSRQTSPGRIKFKDAAEREVSLPISLKGVSMAIEALNRQQ